MNFQSEEQKDITFQQKVKRKILNIFTSITALIIPLIQYVPTVSLYFGFMSLPLLIYLTYFFAYPDIIFSDFMFFRVHTPYFFLAIFGASITVYSFIYQLIHYKKELLKSGPYKLVRHPQYLGIIIMTFSLTMVCLDTTPIIYFNRLFYSLTAIDIIVLVFILETLAYILLAKMEDYSLRKRYGEEFLAYRDKVGFLFPHFKLKTIYEKRYLCLKLIAIVSLVIILSLSVITNLRLLHAYIS